MDSHRKMLSSGTAASSRSARVRSTGAERALATLIGRSVCGRAEHEAWIQVGLAPHEPARHLGERAGVDHEPEPLAGGVGYGHEDGVGARSGDYRLDLHQAAEDRNAL